MSNFRIVFERPWLLLLLIPAIFFSLLPYFRSPKKYRRTRNRITSVVLHTSALLLSILVLCGITFQYDVPNEETEVILLVDKSDSNAQSDDEKDNFVSEVLAIVHENFKIGVVTFGYDQVYAAELSNDSRAVYQEYLRAPLPDGSATDYAAALTYAASLFSKPESARIVLLSDGIETDGNVKSVIRSIAGQQGIKVDTVHFPDEQTADVQILGVNYPETTIRHGESFELSLDILSTYEGEAVLSMYDDATQIGESVRIRLAKGAQSVKLDAIVPIPGLHKLTFEIESASDLETRNNVYNSHLYIETFDKLLVIESIDGESESLRTILDGKKITVVNAADQAKMPKTLDDLRDYDEIVMVNVANSDLPSGFDTILYRYVKEVGGGLFTVCGNEDDGNPNDALFEANAFTEEDMAGSLYQELLPVEIITYTPPVAVVIVIDTSGSMWGGKGSDESYEGSKLHAAQQGAEACLDALTERDWVGIMTFSDNSLETLELTPRVQRDKILASIDKLKDMEGGYTYFAPALMEAGTALSALSSVERRHIILVTDGAPSDTEEEYGAAMKRNADLGITMSIVGIEAGSGQAAMERALVKYANVEAKNFHNVTDVTATATVMREDLEVPEIKAVNYETFTPTIETYNSVVDGIKESDMPTLDGFYGTKLKEGAEAVLMGKFVPIYAQHKVGKGTVGSFLCDLNGTWSSDFITSETGKQLIINMVESLYPTESIQLPEIRLSLKEQNYSSEMNIFADPEKGDSVTVEIISRFNSDIPTQTLYPLESDEFGKISFTITEPGVYEIKVTKYNAEGTPLATQSIYKSFSYSKEYDIVGEEMDYSAVLASISEAGEGFVLTESYEVFENVMKYLHRIIDPRILFILIALVAFLVDVAVRKFKFKWPHEILRSYLEKKGVKK